MIKKVLKYLLIVTAGIFLLMLLFLLFTQTALFRKVVKDKFTEFAASQWNVQIEIEQIDGNFYSNLELLDVSISKNSDTLLSFSSLKLDYNVLDLRNRQITADTILLKNSSINIWQNPDSTWNFIELFGTTNKSASKEKQPFKFVINANYVAIKNGSISASTFVDLIPTSLTGLNIEVDGMYRTNEILANLRELNFQTVDPTLNVKELSTSFKMVDNDFFADSLILRTASSNIFIDASYRALDFFHAKIKASPLDKQELAIFLPTFKLAFSPEIKTEVLSENDTTSAQIELKNGNQVIIVDAQFHSLKKAIKDKTVKAPFFVDALFNNVIPEEWMEMNNTNSIINGEIKLNGSHLLNYKLPIKVAANLENSVYHERVFNKFLITGTYANDNIETEIDLQTNNAAAKIEGNLSYLTSQPVYNVSIITDSLNLTSFIPEIDSTILNAHILANGVGFSNSTRKIEATVQLEKSTVYKIPVNSAEMKIRMDKQEIFIDSMNLLLPDGPAVGSGYFDLSTNYLSADVKVDVDSLSFLNQFITLPVSFNSISVDAKIKGQPIDLAFSGDAILNNAEGYSMKLDEMETSFSGRIKKDSINVKAKLMAIEFETEPIIWDTLNAEIEYMDNKIVAEINALWRDTLNAFIKTKIQLGDTITAEFPLLEAKTFFSHYYLADTLQSVQISKDLLNIKNLWVKDYNQPNFDFKLSGDLSYKQSENIQLSIDHLDLTPFNKFIQIEDSIKGVLYSNFSISGSAQNPIIKGSIAIKNPAFGTISIDEMKSELSYDNKKCEVVFSLTDSASAIEGKFSSVMDAYFDTTGFVFNPPELFEAQINIDSLNFKQKINSEISTIDLSGLVDMDLKANGNFRNPQFFGYLSLSNGYFSDPEYALKYDDIKFLVQFDGNKISLDTFLIKQNDGFMSVNGDVEFDSTMVKGKITSSSLIADASNFFVAKNSSYEIKIDANTFLKRGETTPEFGGTIKVIHSDFNIDELLAKGNDGEDDEHEPLLLQAISVKKDSIITTDIQKSKLKKRENSSAFFKDLTGRVKLDIPRNTWIRSKDMNLELRGEVDVVKTGPFFEIFGNIEINRGHYILYGKKLNINEGEIIFQGGEEIDPMLNFNATYTFRDDKKEKRELDLTVTGLLSDPTIEFFLDEELVTESEAVSILIFGKTIEEMGYSSQNGLVSSMGSSMAAQVVTAQLSKTLGSRFNLDMIEVTATENWQSAAFAVGKYIGNDLFVTYQRGFGETEGDEITPETITLEYELNRILFLRLQSGSSKTSGFDVILKFEQKMKD